MPGVLFVEKSLRAFSAFVSVISASHKACSCSLKVGTALGLKKKNVVVAGPLYEKYLRFREVFIEDLLFF